MTSSSSTPPAPWRSILLGVHVAAAVGLIGAAAALAGLGVSGLRGADPRSVFPPAHLVDAWVVLPLALLALATGEFLPLAIAPSIAALLLIINMALGLFKPGPRRSGRAEMATR